MSNTIDSVIHDAKGFLPGEPSETVGVVVGHEQAPRFFRAVLPACATSTCPPSPRRGRPYGRQVEYGAEEGR